MRPVGTRIAGRRLYTATLVDAGRGASLVGFFASVTRDEREFRVMLRDLAGDRLLELSVVRHGLDLSDPFALALLSTSMIALLQSIEANPDGPLADGFELLLEQRRDLR